MITGSIYKNRLDQLDKTGNIKYISRIFFNIDNGVDIIPADLTEAEKFVMDTQKEFIAEGVEVPPEWTLDGLHAYIGQMKDIASGKDSGEDEVEKEFWGKYHKKWRDKITKMMYDDKCIKALAASLVVNFFIANCTQWSSAKNEYSLKDFTEQMNMDYDNRRSDVRKALGELESLNVIKIKFPDNRKAKYEIEFIKDSKLWGVRTPNGDT